jgi:hypothetical protein
MSKYVYSQYSVDRLITCHQDIQKVAYQIINAIDARVLWGFRDEEAQNEAYEQGNSEKQWPYSKHNTFPSLAIDIVPYPLDWKDTKSFYYLAGHMLMAADVLGINLRWGGDWNMNDNLNDQRFFDLAHYELVGA